MDMREVKAVVGELFAQDRGEVSQEEHRDFMRTAWRVTRELARLQGMPLDERLEDWASERRNSPWEVGLVPAERAPGGMALARRFVEARELMSLAYRRHSGGGLPIGAPGPSENSEASEAQARWVEVVRAILRGMKIERDAAIYRVVRRPRGVEERWPDPEAILVYEESTIEGVLEDLVKLGAKKTQKNLAKKGLLRHEIRSLIALSGREAQEITSMGTDEARGLAILRNDEFRNSAQESMNLRGVAQALKQEMILRGLGRTEPENPLTIFAGIVKAQDEREAAPDYGDATIDAISTPKRITG